MKKKIQTGENKKTLRALREKTTHFNKHPCGSTLFIINSHFQFSILHFQLIYSSPDKKHQSLSPFAVKKFT